MVNIIINKIKINRFNKMINKLNNKTKIKCKIQGRENLNH